ncbi:hypothetical protein [Moorena producens]
MGETPKTALHRFRYGACIINFYLESDVYKPTTKDLQVCFPWR